MNKPILSLALILVLVLGITGCGDKAVQEEYAQEAVTGQLEQDELLTSIKEEYKGYDEEDVEYGYNIDPSIGLNKERQLFIDAELTIAEDYLVKCIEDTDWVGKEPESALNEFHALTTNMSSLADTGSHMLGRLTAGVPAQEEGLMSLPVNCIQSHHHYPNLRHGMEG